jgi:hypothetical protein
MPQWLRQGAHYTDGENKSQRYFQWLAGLLKYSDSHACLVADEHDMRGNLARLLKAAGQKAPVSQPILEINPKHPVVCA